MTKNSFYCCKSISDNGGQKNLGMCEKALPSNCYVEPCSASKDNFLFGFGFTPSFPHFPLQCCGQKSTHSHPFCFKFNFVWGGRGGVASFGNITGKVPTLLTSIVALLGKRRFLYACFYCIWSTHTLFNHLQTSLPRCTKTILCLHGQNLISRTRGSGGHLEKIPTENNEKFTKKCGISKIICDTAYRAIYLNTRTPLIMKGWLI